MPQCLRRAERIVGVRAEGCWLGTFLEMRVALRGLAIEAVTRLVGADSLGHPPWLLPTDGHPRRRRRRIRAPGRGSLSTPTCAPSGTTTSLSMIAFCTTAIGGDDGVVHDH